MKWAITKITTWKNKVRAKDLYQIHGTADRIFPIKYINPYFKVNGGGHFMVYDRHSEVSEILTQILKNN